MLIKSRMGVSVDGFVANADDRNFPDGSVEVVYTPGH
jgi:acylphosphatase